MIQYITRDGSSPTGKQKVFFCADTAQPKDLLDAISEDIFEYCHCAIWYEDGVNTSLSVVEEAIAASSLVVLTITQELFAPDSVLRQQVLPLVTKHHVPLLPILDNPTLLDPFNAHFSNIQVLSRFDTDSTALPYRQKLERFLQDVLTGDELADRIKQAFSSWVFLSYRKVDRKLVRELMRMVQNNHACCSIGFWYDEFLTPGEEFNRNIEDAIDGSQLFLLALTQNMTHEGNYVIVNEYPYARQSGKPILPVELEEVDPALVQDKFPGLPHIVPLEQVASALSQLGREECTPEQYYLLGLACLRGLHQEKNPRVATELLIQSAALGYAPAALQLSMIRFDADSYAQSNERQLHWLYRYADLCQRDFRAVTTIESVRTFADAMERLASALCGQGNTQEGFTRYEQARKLLETARMGAEYAQCCSNYGIELTRAGKFQEGIEMLYQTLQFHLASYDRDPEYGPAHREEMAYCYYNISYIAKKMGRWKLAKGMVETAIGNFAYLVRTSPEDYTQILSHCYDNLGIILRNLWEQTGQTNDLEQAIACHEEAIKTLEPMLVRRPNTFEPDYGNSCISLTAAYLRAGRLEEARLPARIAVEIFRAYHDRHTGQYTAELAKALGNRAVLHFQLQEYPQSLTDLQESEVLLRQLFESKSDLAMTLWNQGNTYAAQSLYRDALQCYREALSIYESGQLPDYTRDPNYGYCCHNYANALYESGKLPEALKQITAALAVFEKLEQEIPGAYKTTVEKMAQFQAHILHRLGKH